MLRALVAETRRPGAVRLFLRLCRRPCPKPCRWCGRRRRCRPPGTVVAGRGGRQAPGGDRSDGPKVLGRPARRRRIPARLRHHQAGHRRLCASAFRPLAQAGAGRPRPVDVSEIEELWHGLARPMPGCSPGWRAGGQAGAGGEGAVRPVMLATPLGEGELKSSTGRLCGRMEYGTHPRAGGPRRRRHPALFAHRRRHIRRLSRPCRGNCVRGRAGRRASGRLARFDRPPSPTCSSG